MLCDAGTMAIPGSVTIGLNDTDNGVLSIYGHTTSSVAGGVLNIFTAADYDATIEAYVIKADSDDLHIGPSTDTDSLKYFGTGNYWAFTGGLVTLGLNDNVSGLLQLMGNGTSSNTGGTIQLFLAADYDAVISNFTIQAFQDDFSIGPDTDTDSFKYSGGLDVYFVEFPPLLNILGLVLALL